MLAWLDSLVSEFEPSFRVLVKLTSFEFYFHPYRRGVRIEQVNRGVRIEQVNRGVRIERADLYRLHLSLKLGMAAHFLSIGNRKALEISNTLTNWICIRNTPSTTRSQHGPDSFKRCSKFRSEKGR
jgi:hypothetical protein